MLTRTPRTRGLRAVRTRGTGQLAPRAPSTVRLPHACQPRACRTYRVRVVLSPQAQLAEWGCDAELWQGLRSGGRANLKKQVKKGDEAGARARIEALKLLVKETPKKAVPCPCRKRARYMAGRRGPSG